jgi:hypothetical protein
MPRKPRSSDQPLLAHRPLAVRSEHPDRVLHVALVDHAVEIDRLRQTTVLAKPLVVRDERRAGGRHRTSRPVQVQRTVMALSLAGFLAAGHSTIMRSICPFAVRPRTALAPPRRRPPGALGAAAPSCFVCLTASHPDGMMPPREGPAMDRRGSWLSRRAFVLGAGGVAGTTLLAGCGGCRGRDQARRSRQEYRALAG